MKKTMPLFLAFALLLFPGPLAVSPSMAQLPPCEEDDREIECDEDDFCVAEIFVELLPGVTTEEIEQDYGVSLVDSLPQLRFHLFSIQTEPGEDAEEIVDGIVDLMEEDQDRIKRAEPHRSMETPEGVQLSIPDLGIQAEVPDFELQPAAQTVSTEVAQTRYTGTGVTVAIVDTGMSFDHPLTADLILEPGVDFAGGNGTGQVQPNCVDVDGDGLMDEGLHHATFVAGLVHLVAPNARILPIRALETDGKGAAFDVARAILYAVAVGARVINLSDSMLHEARSIEEAIEQAQAAGVVVVAAAGNRGQPIVEDVEEGCKSFPAYRSEVIAVAAVDPDLVKAEFSDYGPAVDLSAPGVDLLSTFGKTSACGIVGEPPEVDFAAWSGTSFAAPLVSGAAALILEKYPCLTPAEVRDLLTQSVQDFSESNPAEFDGLLGTGVLDLDKLTLKLTDDRCSLRAQTTSTGTVLSWSPVLDATHYDVVRGDLTGLEPLPGQVGLGPLSCVADDLTETDTSTLPDPETPLPGQVFFYLFRDDAPAGGYGASSSGIPRVPGGSDCDAP